MHISINLLIAVTKPPLDVLKSFYKTPFYQYFVLFVAAHEILQNNSRREIIHIFDESYILRTLCSRRGPIQNSSNSKEATFIWCQTHPWLLCWRRYQPRGSRKAWNGVSEEYLISLFYFWILWCNNPFDEQFYRILMLFTGI